MPYPSLFHRRRLPPYLRRQSCGAKAPDPTARESTPDYLAVGVMVVGRTVKPWALLVLVSLPLALKILRIIARARLDDTDRIAAVDVQTAQLHLVFCVLLSIGLALSAVL